MEKTERLLEQLDISGEVFEHPSVDGSHSADVAKALGYPKDHILKCLILKSKKKEYLSALIISSERLDIKRLEELSEMRKLSFASKEEVKVLTGFEAGGVPPFAVLEKMPLYVDAHVLVKPYVIGSGGTPYHGLKFDPQILNTLPCTICHIVK